ncbi:MAG: acetyl-CoA decarbonylase/synthase complex subunit delta [Eubacteriales bacterium]|nr:acetyl-CoA decarbonylase/synthase complex subunit delta [Eubacteriales bacterium]
MPFTAKSGKFNASIKPVTIGSGDKAATIGGENVLPFYSFDAEIANAPKVGIEVTDFGMEHEPECLKKYYDGCTTAADMVKKAVAFEGVDFISFRMEGGDPNGANKSTEDLMATLGEVIEAAGDMPLVICGSKNAERDAELLQKAAELAQGKNAIILAAREENYKTVGAAAGLAYNQIVGAESSVDINLAKQLNVLLTQLGVNASNVVMNVGSAAAGYGYEYVASTMQRIKAAALSQNDAQLQMPIITPVASEAWATKEASASEEDVPGWGDVESRGIDMEVETAAADLACGSNAVILKHPVSVATVSKLIKELV